MQVSAPEEIFAKLIFHNYTEKRLVRAGWATPYLTLLRVPWGASDVLQHSSIYLSLDSAQTNKKVCGFH